MSTTNGRQRTLHDDISVSEAWHARNIEIRKTP